MDKKKKIIWRCSASLFAIAMSTCLAMAQIPMASEKTATPPKPANNQSCCAIKARSAFSKKQSAKFAARADALLGTGPTGKGEWGLLILDAKTGETLYQQDRKSTRLNSSHLVISYAVFCLKKKK